MSATKTATPSPRTPWSAHSPTQVQSIPPTTPAGFPVRTPGSIGQPTLSASKKNLSPRTQREAAASTPSYFEHVSEPENNPLNSSAGYHAKKNWANGSFADRPTSVTSPQNQPLESQKRFENFRRQSGNNSFTLHHGNLRQFSDSESVRKPKVAGGGGQNTKPVESPSPTEDGVTTAQGQDEMDVDPPSDLRDVPRRPLDSSGHSFFGRPQMESPSTSLGDISKLPRDQISHIDERHPRNSLPHNRPDKAHHAIQRAETLPESISTDGPVMISPEDLLDLIKTHLPQDFLLLDLRVFAQYTKSRISGALNLCIPTTLLKRPSYNVQKLADTFSNKVDEKAKFDSWQYVRYIAVYDAASMHLKDATSCVNVVKKFTNENWTGATFILRGGFNNFSKKCPEQIEERPASGMDGSSTKKLSIDPPTAAPVAGGCMMPATQTAANPFFGTIRQNLDLIDGVGQMPVKMPSTLKEEAVTELPAWLRQVSDGRNQGKAVADRFLGIEKTEQQRMQKALSTKVSYGTPNPLSPNGVQVAGIEKGSKNRYKDILPFDHSRVRLQDVPSGGCDYVNASHIRAERSNRHYIASQAPVPTTFQDFWRVAWEQDTRVIVMLTAETEGGQRKCHPYWVPGEYGPFKIKALSERRLPLEHSTSKPSRSFTSPLKFPTPDQRPGIGQRRSTNYSTTSKDLPTPRPPLNPEESPHIIIRKLTLTHTAYPFEPLRELTQLQYSSWPDFGAPAHPAHVLALVEHCDSVVRAYQSGPNPRSAHESAREGERPIVVHCSAGCGRTGTFCTVDSVVDMLKRQRRHRRATAQADGVHDHDAMDVDDWLDSDEVDLVQKAVEDFRRQRLSMVQTLRQFVLCYESVLEWVVGEMPRGGMGGERKSWAG